MWWEEESEFENAADVGHFLRTMKSLYFGSSPELPRPSWFRGVGAIPLYKQRAWGAVVYVDSRLDPRRRIVQGPRGALLDWLYDLYGPVPGLHSSTKLAGQIQEGHWSPEIAEMTFDELSHIIRFNPLRFLSHLVEHMVAARRFRDDSRIWHLLLPVPSLVPWELDQPFEALAVDPPRPTFMYFVGRVHPISYRVKSVRSRSYGSIGAAVAAGSELFFTTAGHSVNPATDVRIRKRRRFWQKAKQGTVSEHHDPASQSDDPDLALIELSRGLPTQFGHQLAVLPPKTLEQHVVHAHYSGGSLGYRTLRVYLTATPLTSEDGSREWTGYLAHTGDRRRVGARGDSGAAVIESAGNELVGHLVASTNAQGAIVQSGTHEVSALTFPSGWTMHKIED